MSRPVTLRILQGIADLVHGQWCFDQVQWIMINWLLVKGQCLTYWVIDIYWWLTLIVKHPGFHGAPWPPGQPQPPPPARSLSRLRRIFPPRRWAPRAAPPGMQRRGPWMSCATHRVSHQESHRDVGCSSCVAHIFLPKKHLYFLCGQAALGKDQGTLLKHRSVTPRCLSVKSSQGFGAGFHEPGMATIRDGDPDHARNWQNLFIH